MRQRTGLLAAGQCELHQAAGMVKLQCVLGGISLLAAGIDVWW